MAKEENSASTFDLSAGVHSVDEGTMTVIGGDGRLTDWVWTFSGSSHDNTIRVNERATRDLLNSERQMDQSRRNGKKVIVPDDVRRKNAEMVAIRLLGWTSVLMAGEDYSFTTANAGAILSDPKNGKVLVQAVEFLAEDSSFTKRSATA